MSDTPEIKRGEKGHFLPGTAPGPGRPEGSVSIITKIKQKFENDPEMFDAYVSEVLADPKLRQEIIRQLDGAPRQKVDITTAGESLNNPVKELTDAELTELAYGSEEGAS